MVSYLQLAAEKKTPFLVQLEFFLLFLFCDGFNIPTLYNVILRIARNLLETKENIKIESHPFYDIICDWFSWGSSKIFIFFDKKKIQNGRLKKTEFFRLTNSQFFYFF
jgi:hypothetical protein